MALSADLEKYLFKYSKDWRNPIDFETYESREEKVREDMQYLFEEIKTQFNTFLEEAFNASKMPFEESEQIPDVTSVQAAIENVRGQIATAVLGQINPRSLTGDRLELGAVTEDELADDAVTEDKIYKDSVTRDKIGPGAVGADEIELHTLTQAHFDTHAFDGFAQLDGNILVRGNRVWRVKDGQISSAYTLIASDAESILVANNSAPCSITLPVHGTGDIKVGTSILLFAAGTGTLTISPATGVSLYSSQGAGSILINKQYSMVLLTKSDQSVWRAGVFGIQAQQVDTTELANDAVTTLKIDNLAVIGDKLANNSVSTRTIVTGAVTYDKTFGVQKLHEKFTLEVPALPANNSYSVEVNCPAGVVLSSADVIEVSPAPGDFYTWRNSGVYCSAHGSNTLTFTAESPVAATTAQVVVWAGEEVEETEGEST